MKPSEALIVIGREYGSGGRALGRELSRRMDIAMYDQELLNASARELGIALPALEHCDERKPSVLRSMMEGAFGLSPGAQGGYSASFTTEGLHAMQCKVIEMLSERGGAIFVGRTADYVLRDNKRLLSVFVHSSPECRVKRIIQRGECSNETKALELIRRKDRLRQSYYNFYTGRCWGAANNYHLSLDLEKIGLEKGAELIINTVLAM